MRFAYPRHGDSTARPRAEHSSHRVGTNAQRLDVRRPSPAHHRYLHQLGLLPGGEDRPTAYALERMQSEPHCREGHVEKAPPAPGGSQDGADHLVVGERLWAYELGALRATVLV